MNGGDKRDVFKEFKRRRQKNDIVKSWNIDQGDTVQRINRA